MNKSCIGVIAGAIMGLGITSSYAWTTNIYIPLTFANNTNIDNTLYHYFWSNGYYAPDSASFLNPTNVYIFHLTNAMYYTLPLKVGRNWQFIGDGPIPATIQLLQAQHPITTITNITSSTTNNITYYTTNYSTIPDPVNGYYAQAMLYSNDPLFTSNADSTYSAWAYTFKMKNVAIDCNPYLYYTNSSIWPTPTGTYRMSGISINCLKSLELDTVYVWDMHSDGGTNGSVEGFGIVCGTANTGAENRLNIHDCEVDECTVSRGGWVTGIAASSAAWNFDANDCHGSYNVGFSADTTLRSQGKWAGLIIRNTASNLGIGMGCCGSSCTAFASNVVHNCNTVFNADTGYNTTTGIQTNLFYDCDTGVYLGGVNTFNYGSVYSNNFVNIFNSTYGNRYMSAIVALKGGANNNTIAYNRATVNSNSKYMGIATGYSGGALQPGDARSGYNLNNTFAYNTFQTNGTTCTNIVFSADSPTITGNVPAINPL